MEVEVANYDRGNEIGPFRAVEESTIAHITAKEHMSDIYAWYSLIGTAGTALGMMVCGWVMSILQDTKHWDFVPACRVVFVMYAVVGAVKFVLTMGLTKSVEVQPKKKKPDATTAAATETDPLLASDGRAESVVAPKKRKIFFLPGVEAELVGPVVSLLLLFGLDSFGSSLASLYVVLFNYIRTVLYTNES